MSAPRGLARRSMGAGSLWMFAVGASSPMTVLAGGVIATYANTGVVGVPLSFLILAAALGLLAVGFVAMARHVGHAATAYALLAHGLGRPVGVAGAAVALVAYSCIQISLFGLLGATVSGLVGGPWWAWAGVAWALVAWIGVRHVQVNARVLGTFLIVEVAVIGLFDLAALSHPAAEGLSLACRGRTSVMSSGCEECTQRADEALTGHLTAPDVLILSGVKPKVGLTFQ